MYLALGVPYRTSEHEARKRQRRKRRKIAGSHGGPEASGTDEEEGKPGKRKPGRQRTVGRNGRRAEGNRAGRTGRNIHPVLTDGGESHDIAIITLKIDNDDDPDSKDVITPRDG